MPDILIIDDNLNDIDLIRRALIEIEAKITVHDVESAVRAFGFLREHQKEPHLSLIVLDQRLPVFSGIETLKMLRESEETRRIPVIICSSYLTPSDIAAAYEAGATCVEPKPSVWAEFLQLACLIRDLAQRR